MSTPTRSPAARTSRTRKPPTLRYERQAWRSGAGVLAAVDEVGRGALAGPVSVGVVLLAPDCKPAPLGVADSKLLTPQARVRLVPRIRRWALDSAVGHASAAEIDRIGIIAALRLAAERAVSQLNQRPDWVLLDGNHDYLTRREPPALIELDELDGVRPAGRRAFEPSDADHGEPDRWRCEVPVRTLIKGDLRCASVAAASVLAKTERDAMLIELAEHYPQYGFAENKAYASTQHLTALLEHGPSAVHRCSWNLPGTPGWNPRTSRLADLLPGGRDGQPAGALTDELEIGDDGQMISAGTAR